MTAPPTLPRVRAAATVAGVAGVVVAVLPSTDPRTSDVLFLLAQVVAVAVLGLATLRRDADEDAVWRWWAGAVGVLTLGPVVGLATGVEPGRVIGLCALAATPLMYQALVRWNRFRTYVSDPGDWLNGVSATFSLAAAGLLVEGRTGFLPASWPYAQVQVWMLILAALVILLGTAATVAGVGGLSRDPRMWLVLGVLVGLIGLSATLTGHDADPLRAQAGWTLAALVLAFASTLRGRAVPVAATSQAPAVGALVVLVLAVGVLVVDGHAQGWTATLYAVVAVLCVSVRVLHLVRELAQLAESRVMAVTDELTGAGNRRALLRALESLVTDGRAAALLLLDVDHFKEVNDRQGHHAGDDLLRRVVTATRRALPSDAVLTRIGGDEFAVLLPGRTEEEAAAVGRVVHENVVVGVDIGLSIGVRSVPAGTLDPDQLLRQADTAMYSAKTGGGGVSVYDSEVDARLRDRAALAADLRSLLSTGGARLRQEVVVHYQPQVDVLTGRVVGTEALVRWQHPERGLLPPLTFLDLVESLGLMDQLTIHVLNLAAQEAADWSHDGVPLRISVNLSASSLAHPELLRLVDRVLEEHALTPGRLVLEVTETTLMADPDLALEVTHALTRRGVQLSIDDYGTGYSSLAYLTDLPATELKLDRAFTVRVLAEPRTAEIVGATVALAHRLGLRVVAEGVEDEATRAVLGGLDVDESQGYLHSRPLSPAEFSRWLATVARPRRCGPDTTADGLAVEGVVDGQVVVGEFAPREA